MTPARTLLFAIACALPLAASAQWMWLDKSGRKVFSDAPPPADTAPERILKQPGGRSGAMAAPVSTTTAASPAANVPKVAGKDKELQDKKKQLDAAEAEKKKAEEAKVAALRAENCNRAKNSKANYESGVRISRMNDKGEREILDDSQRAAEIKVLDQIITRDCRQLQ